MKVYERYKPSKVEWVEQIPLHWEVKRLKYCFTLITEKSDLNLPKVGLENIESNTGRFLETSSIFEGEGIDFKANDILFGKLRPYLAKVYLSEFDGKAIGDFYILRCNQNINPKFGQKLLISKNFINIVNDSTHGSRMPRVSWDFMGNLHIPIPEQYEQEIIANYLDKKTAEIEELITDKKRLIYLLKQEKELTISNAVTRGLNPDVPMKDSKVRWIGEIPEQWSLRKISHSFNTIGSGTTPLTSNSAYYTDGTIPWINTGDLNNDYLIDINKTVSTLAVEENSALKIYPKDSLVIAMYGATIGKIGITTFEACVNQACCVLAGSDYFTLRYIYYWFIANKKYIIDLGYGGGQPNISQEIIKSLRIPCPLSEEQQQIVGYLDKKIAETNEAVQIIKDEIELLKEYKETLIYEVITGKIDVRAEL